MRLITLLILAIVVSCGKIGTAQKSSKETQNVSAIYSSAQLNIKVYYEEGAEPYTDNVGTFNLSLWDIFEMNIGALLEGRRTTLSVPKTLGEMIKLKTYSKSTWSVEEVQKMAKEYSLSPVKSVTNFQIFFVNGRSSEGSTIIGFHISNTQTMVIFKDVIKEAGSDSTEVVKKYVEQATLIHEMGHALGLVNNGVKMQVSHQDSTHGAHCSNENCVMFYANEGAGSLKKYLENVILSKKLIMFDQQCLNDALNYQK